MRQHRGDHRENADRYADIVQRSALYPPNDAHAILTIPLSNFSSRRRRANHRVDFFFPSHTEHASAQIRFSTIPHVSCQVSDSFPASGN